MKDLTNEELVSISAIMQGEIARVQTVYNSTNRDLVLKAKFEDRLIKYVNLKMKLDRMIETAAA
jgi:predicted ArsR family transcriptional regulator